MATPSSRQVLKKAYLVVLDISTERAVLVFHLDGSDRGDFVGTAEGGSGNLAKKTKVLDFSFPTERTIICAPEDVTAANV